MAHIGSAFRARVQHGYEVEFYSWSLRSIGECVRGGRGSYGRDHQHMQGAGSAPKVYPHPRKRNPGTDRLEKDTSLCNDSFSAPCLGC